MKPVVTEVRMTKLALPYHGQTSDLWANVRVEHATEMGSNLCVRVGFLGIGPPVPLTISNSQALSAKDLREVAALFVQIAAELEREEARV